MGGKQSDSSLGNGSVARPDDPLDLGVSVAGEEDPGAAIDMTQPRVQRGTPQPQEAPRDDVPSRSAKTGGA